MDSRVYDSRTIIDDMIDGCCDVVGRDAAIKGIRAVCRYFGGTPLYIPVSKTTGDTIEEFHGVLCDAVGDHDADVMMDKIMSLFGHHQIYIPMEKKAFQEVIAHEIYERYGGNKENMRDLCREYGMSFTQIYRLWKKGRKNKAKELKHDYKE
jgi:Mor family transcriptional regulator